jgi:two-component system OmpR family sensor kinase
VKHHSILLKISLFFLIAFIAMTGLFKIMYDHEFTSVRENLRVHYHHVAMNVMRWKFGGESKEQLLHALQKDNIQIISDPELYEDIITEEKFDTVYCAKGEFDIFEKDGYRYIIAPNSVGEMLMKDLKTEPVHVFYVWWLYGGFVIVLFALFLSITISIYPIKHLQVQIRRFGEGNMDLDLASNRKDEIAEVANEFDNAVKKIQGMMNSRAIFLRNITHELKTPVTKGQLSLEFLEPSRTKEILSDVFVRLNLLMREFLQIENVTSCDCHVDKKNYNLIDILDNATDLLFLEPGSIENNLAAQSIEADFDLMSIVFKNLIDNGIKYSTDGKVFLKIEDSNLSFCSQGNKMEYPLEHYIQPFTKCDMNVEDSFGLGLYIIYYILVKHGFSLSYEYKEGLNCFIIELKKKKRDD